ncbi:unnamed protein product [Cuscuta epithymum]|uniref:TF-B3 domain-containing protein n=1 Tax=Cuscuta epithymum TaxID=186058 RepID=A0AAV0GA47_9ASTE|nr:unnamed protein product [Cuscuta epithymum]
MGDSSCMGCKKVEETIYWSQFQTVQFFQVLSGLRYDHHLAIPKKFSENLRGKLAGTVRLKGPSGSVWEVGLASDGESLYLKRGWKKFVREHSLQKNDVLVFKYNGNLQFDVFMFDQLSLCEKEASYFVKQCAHKELTGADKTEKTTPRARTIYLESTSNESAQEEDERKVVKRPRKDGTSPKENHQSSGKLKKKSVDRSGPSSNVSPLRWESNRRAVTEEEKDKAIQAASSAASDDSLTVVMREYHVHKGFYMSIPVEWSRKHLPQKNFDVCMRMKEKTWMAKAYFRKATSGHGVSGAGWKYFVLENSLEIDDVCLFNLVSESSSLCVFDVRIFRVIDDVLPRKVMGTSSKGKPGRPCKNDFWKAD